MHIKNIHCMVEKLAECAKCEVEKGIEQLNTEEMGEVTDMIKDLCEAEYYARIAKCMEKSEEEDEAEEKHFIKMLKEQYKDEYKEMKEQYGDEADRRFYDSWRHADGSFAKKGTGEYRPRSYYRRRGYAEPMYHMPMNMYHDYSPEELRDMDRDMGRMYYGGGSSGGNGGTSGQSGGSGMSGGSSGGSSGGNSGGSSRGYEDGYNEGNRRGYSEGYEQGNRDGRSQGGNSRYERAKRGYEETKEKHKGNTPEDKQLTMREAEKMLNVVFDEIDEMIEDAPPEMKSMVKTKGMARFQKIS